MKFDEAFNREGPAFIADLYNEDNRITMQDVMAAWSNLMAEAQADTSNIKRQRAQHKREFIRDIMKDNGFRADVFAENPRMTQADLKTAAEAYFESYVKSGDAPWFMTSQI